MVSRPTTKYDSFWTRRYRLKVWLWRKFRFRDLLWASIFGIFGLIIVLIGTDPAAVFPYVILLWLAALAYLVLIVRARSIRLGLQGEVISSLFAFINNHIFDDTNKTRFTMFRRAPFRPRFLVPWWRYERAGGDPVREALISRARYSHDEGLTGRVWRDCDRVFTLYMFPKFIDRETMEAYYISEFGLQPENAAAISDHMVEVTAILSCVLLDKPGRFIGLLSIDFRDSQIVEDDDEDSYDFTIQTFEGEEVKVDAGKLTLLIQALGDVLESFQLEEEVSL